LTLAESQAGLLSEALAAGLYPTEAIEAGLRRSQGMGLREIALEDAARMVQGLEEMEALQQPAEQTPTASFVFPKDNQILTGVSYIEYKLNGCSAGCDYEHALWIRHHSDEVFHLIKDELHISPGSYAMANPRPLKGGVYFVKLAISRKSAPIVVSEIHRTFVLVN
jgi:hypothetical protein